MEKNGSRVFCFGESDRALEESGANSFATFCFQDRHAPYLGAVSAHDNPCRSNRLSFRESEKVKCSHVVPIQFDILRYTLFSYKNLHANAESMLQFLFGRDSLDVNGHF